MKHDVYSNLKGWQKTQVARHPDRPYTLDYIKYIFTEFIEFHGDRRGGYGPSVVGGLAKFDNSSVLIIGHQKGRDTNEKIKRNFGMPKPEGYRKALRLHPNLEACSRTQILHGTEEPVLVWPLARKNRSGRVSRSRASSDAFSRDRQRQGRRVTLEETCRCRKQHRSIVLRFFG